jgi:PAS domain S-box-containing protein
MVKLPIVESVISLVRKSGPARRGTQRDTSARLRAMFESAPAGIACASTDGHFLFFNERFRELTGHTREQLGRFTFQDITLPEDVRSEAPLAKKLLRGDGGSYRIEKRVVDRRGKHRDLVVNCALVRDEHDATEFLVYVIDEPPRAQARAATRESEHLLASVLERIRELAIIRTDEKGVIVGWNAGAARIFGYAREEIIGKPRRNLFRDADNWESRSTQQFREAAESGRIESEDWRVAKNGTHLWVTTSLMPVKPDGANVRGYLEIIAQPMRVDARVPELKRTVESLRDELSERQRTETSLRDALEEAQRTNAETMNELKIMAAALRDEIMRRKAAEAKGAPILEEKPPVVEPPKRAWKKLQHPVRELLVAQAAEQRSGTLVIAEGELQTEVFFDEGRIFSVATNDPSRFLAQRLIAIGLISEEQRQRALEIQRETHLALGRILVVLNAIDEETLLAVMRRKAEEEIEATCAWTGARYAFVEGDIPTLQLVPLRIDVIELFERPAETTEVLLTDADVPDLEIPPPPPAEPSFPIDALYFASASGKTRKFHRASCISVIRINEETRVVFTNANDAMNAGYESCRLCMRDES